MKVIFTADVENVALLGQVKEVTNGYARNYLLPRGLAIPATPGALKQMETKKAAEERRLAKLESELKGFSDRLDGLSVTLRARTGAEGRLYGSITAQDVAEAIQQTAGHEIDRRKVGLPTPIRTAGEHEVVVKLSRNLNPRVKVIVESENAPTARPAVATAPQAGEEQQPSEASEPTEATEA
ncbi:MAG TPA: 50S ribosomal protein L9 [Dehalococcoidia bacterium]|nr:50S ribosomal protein L9 [Dehalococcoidia bacterium]